MAVDFASKQRDRAGKGWGLRNAKLRMSRKLIFASGLLICFSARLDSDLQNKISTDTNDVRFQLGNHIRDYVRMTPLEVLESFIKRYNRKTPEQCIYSLAFVHPSQQTPH